MNSQTQIENRWTALVFGAVFNFLTVDLADSLIEHTLKAVIGGIVWLAFQVIADKLKERGKEAADKSNEKKEK